MRGGRTRTGGFEGAARGPSLGAEHVRSVERTFRRYLHRAMVLPVVVLTLGSAVLAALVLYLQNLHRWVDHTDVVMGRANVLQRLIAEREGALRGYLLSRDPLFLRQFNTVDVTLSPVFDDLQELVANNPPQVELLRSARVEVIRFRHYAALQVDRVFEKATTEDIASHLREGVAIGEKIRSGVRQFIEVEQGLRAARAHRADTLTWYLLLGAVVLGLVLGGAMALATARQMRLVRERYVEVLEEQRRTQDALASANERLRKADRHKDEFLGVLSHELRNPLAPINNCVHILARASHSSEQAARARAIIARQVEHLARLVEDLLDVKRLSAGKMRVAFERIDLATPIRETVEDLRPLFAQKALHLELDVRRDPVWVNGDPTRLSQVVANLLQNAAKFTDAGGSVRVIVDERDGQGVIRVRDTGVGLAPEILATVFEPFVQGEQTLERSGGGLGLGLALVKGIVDLHGGTVLAHSEGIGTGTEFEVRLPAAPAPTHWGHRVAASEVGVSRRSVLVIEDNDDAAASLRDVLEIAGGHEVYVAHDGAEGLAAARNLHPDVILCDLGLPTMDGYAIARELRESGDAEAMTLVAVSGYAAPDDIDRVLQAGFQHHLAKPADIDTVLRIIAEAPSRAQRCA